MKYWKNIFFNILAIAILLYPSAMAELGAESSLTGEHMVVDVEHNHAVHANQHAHLIWTASEISNPVISEKRESLLAGGEKALPCCCSGAAGLCAVIAEFTPDIGSTKHEIFEIQHAAYQSGIWPAPLPRPPKIYS